jgi:mycothiol S-conjugate amidase
MSERLCLLTVHAHPDDEASKGACTVAQYHSEGVRTVLVCCTGGEEGDILNPAMDTPEVRADLVATRLRELTTSAEVIGYDRVVMLGYRDSGMAGTPANDDPRSFAKAPLDEAVGRLVAIIREERPQVLVTYGEDQQGYPHPDHLRVHEITMVAFDAAGDPDRFPEAGVPWSPSKVYYTVWSGARIRAMHAKFVELGLESPFDEAWLERAANDPPITTLVDVSDHADVRRLALLAHATQVDPTSKFWFGLPPEVLNTVHPYDEYLLARGDSGAGPGEPESDLFAGIRGDMAEAGHLGRSPQAL